ncbi:MAG TPA: aminodeoxychorismate synthase component I [Pyrinomonadaceae bacterium]|nr:aminodeoxychorismate synthase component I [Pyrinomonadaceae bacterium]
MTTIFDLAAFNAPLKTVIATNIGEVLYVLDFAEQQARDGAYVVLMISYEAAPVFDSALVAHESNGFPFAWAAAFSEPSDLPAIRSNVASNSWTAAVTKDEYNESIARIRELIAAGDTYQVNYSFPLTSSFDGNALDWYRQLCSGHPAQYSAYVDLGRYKVLSLSPELFFERRGDHVTTKPMKGTVQRGRTAPEDEELARWLQNSPKNRAENVMIVDLLRNDLGKVSVPGTVHVSSLFELERFETVWQMTSTVEATLRRGTSLAELMGALFPCGSVTGAPKIRTMEIIRELERFPRGAYTGTIGLLRPGGDCTFNVAIRTVVLDTELNVATCSVGGGITIDSNAEDEYEECLVKSRFLYQREERFPQRRKGAKEGSKQER